MLQSKNYYEDIVKRISVLRLYIHRMSKDGLVDINHYCENFVTLLLNHLQNEVFVNLNNCSKEKGMVLVVYKIKLNCENIADHVRVNNKSRFHINCN